MASTFSNGLAAIVTATAAAFGLCSSAAADPVTNPNGPPNPAQELPGLPALAQLSPIIQQAASNPQQATQLLMAAAQAFAHSPTAPTESRNVATSVNQFVADPTSPPAAVVAPDTGPVPHVPPPGVVPGTQAHLPTGIDPVHAAGPAPRCGAGTNPTRFGTRNRDRRPRRGNGHSIGARTRPGAPAGRRPRGGPGFRLRRPADAGLHVSLDRHQLPCGRQ